jgi:hypothetical protein
VGAKLMKKDFRTNLDITLSSEAVMRIENPDMTVEQAIEILKNLGHQILSVNDRDIKVLEKKEPLEEEVYVCEKCGAYSKNAEKVLKHESACNKG